MTSRPRVVVTRPLGNPDSLGSRLKQLNYEVVHVPAIDIGPPRSYEALDRLVENPGQASWLLFTSRNAVRYFVQRSRRLRRHQAVPKGVQIGTVGPETRDTCTRAGLDVAIESSGPTGQDLAKDIVPHATPDSTIVIVQAEGGRPHATEFLKRAGFHARSVAAYRTRNAKVPPATIQDILGADVAALTFTSPSSVVTFAIALGGLAQVPASVLIGVIGQTTASACQRAGRNPDVVAGSPSGTALAEAIAAVLNTPKPE